jgi:hypothetical protein
MEGLAFYKPKWEDSWRTSYRGYEIYCSSGRSFGALGRSLPVRPLEHTDIVSEGHIPEPAGNHGPHSR